MKNSTTKLEIFKALNKVFTSSLLDEFYAITIYRNDISLQGEFNNISVKDINSSFGINSNEWSVSDSGHIELNIDKDLFNVNGKGMTIRITLTA